MNEEQPNNCLNCRFYVAHYFKFKAHLMKIKGHCTNNLISAKAFDKKFGKPEPCGCWQDDGQQKLNERQSITKVLEKMSENLEHIRAILEESD